MYVSSNLILLFLDFKSGYTTEPLEIVDIYQLMTFLLQIDPNPHDGVWDRLVHLEVKVTRKIENKKT